MRWGILETVELYLHTVRAPFLALLHPLFSSVALLCIQKVVCKITQKLLLARL